MSESYSRAIVLARDGRGEYDGEIRLFTEEYGKVSLHAKSIRKTTSKSSGHLQPLRFVQVRWTESKKMDGKLILLDALWDPFMDRYHTYQRHDLIPVIRSIDRMCMEFQKDTRIWRLLEEIFTKHYDAHKIGKALLILMGIHPEKERCYQCGNKPYRYFLPTYGQCVCDTCASQVSTDEILLEV